MSLPLIKTFPMLPMTANERERANRWTLAKEKDDFTLMIPNCPKADCQEKGGPKRLVEVVFLKPEGKRSVDPDALAYRCKSINDALQRRGWIADDDDRHIDLKVSEQYFKGQGSSKTIVAVSEVRG